MKRNTFNHFQEDLKKALMKYRLVLDDHLIRESYNDAILKTIRGEKEDKERYFRKVFKTEILYRMRQKRIYEKKYVLESNQKSDAEDAATFEIADEFILEEFVIKKKAVDRLQLIDDLSKDCDSLTTAIVNEYLNSDKPTPTAIGKKLGVHHMKVTRSLRKLAKNYDETKFGDIQDYLTTA